MPRTIPAIEEQPRKENECYWPCPCGCTVPNPPDYCEHTQIQGKGHTCTDVLCCVHCIEQKNCNAFIEYQKKTNCKMKEDVEIRVQLVKFTQ